MTKITLHRFDASGTALKRCSNCKYWKLLGDFHKRKKNWDGLVCLCKNCKQLKASEYRDKNKVKLAAKKREYRGKNKETIAAKKREYRDKNKERLAAKGRKYYQENKEKIKEKVSRYYQENKEKCNARQCEYDEKNKEKVTVYKKTWGQRKEVKERINKRTRKRRKEDPQFRMSGRIRSGVRNSLKRAQTKKKQTSFKYISCSPSFLLERLERQRIERGLNEDYHIDHMMPIDSFDLKDAEELRRCWHWSNLQALDPEDNLRKSNKILYDMRWNEKRDEWWIRNKDNNGPYRPTALFQSLLLV
jgi:hypothetical protein